MYYEIGNKRPDDKYNVWKKVLVDNYRLEWIIVGVFDTITEANEFVSRKNYDRLRRQKPSYKVNQNA